jgi:nitrate reductase gamma subunit
LFHFAILMVLLGHILGLFTPEWTYNWLMTIETKRLLAIVTGTITGLAALTGIALLAARRLTNKRVRAAGRAQDYIIVLLLLLQIALGLWITQLTARSPIEEYKAVESWAQGIVTFRPDSWKHIADLALVYKIHLVNGFLIFMIFPFTKLMHMVVAPVNFALDFFRK